MALKTFKCMNLGAECANADTGKTFELSEVGTLRCPVCGSENVVPAKVDRMPSAKLVIAAIVLVAALGGIGYYFSVTQPAPAHSSASTAKVSPPPPAPTLPEEKPCDQAMEEAYRKSDYAAVVKIGEGCVAKMPKDATILNNLATCLLKLGQPERASDYLKKAVDLKPNDPYLRYNQGCAAVHAGKKAEAVDHLKKACQLGLAPTTFRQDPDFRPLIGYAPFEHLVSSKNCE